MRRLLFRFEDIGRLDAKARSTVFDRVQADQVVLALRGTSAELREMVLSSIAARSRRMVEHELESGDEPDPKAVAEARRAIKDHGLRTKIISIDPFPRAVIDDLCDQVIRTGLELCDLSIFSDLDRGDVVFIDNSHRSFQNSDVTVFFTEVLPTLNSGTLWSVHDIFLPHDYPGEWLGRFYNEQYLLMTYLFGGAAGDTIEIPVAYIAQSPDLMASFTAALGASPPWGKTPLVGGSFWMHKN